MLKEDLNLKHQQGTKDYIMDFKDILTQLDNMKGDEKKPVVEKEIKSIQSWTKVPVCLDSEGAQIRNQDMASESIFFTKDDSLGSSITADNLIIENFLN
mgnify:CR=1 FL=1